MLVQYDVRPRGTCKDLTLKLLSMADLHILLNQMLTPISVFAECASSKHAPGRYISLSKGWTVFDASPQRDPFHRRV